MSKKVGGRDRKKLRQTRLLARMSFLSKIKDTETRAVVERPFTSVNRQRRRTVGDYTGRKGATGRGGPFFGEDRSWTSKR